jgi:hypothetical protein
VLAGFGGLESFVDREEEEEGRRKGGSGTSI